MQKDVLDDPLTLEGAFLLKRAYERLKHKSWSAIAARYGLTKVRCYRIANRTLKVNRRLDRKLVRAIGGENDCVKRPKALLRAIRKIAIPFLEAHQQSPTHMYLRGGKPWKGW